MGGTRGEVLHSPICSLHHICQVSIVLVNFVLLIKLEESPIFRSIGLTRSLFVSKFGSPRAAKRILRPRDKKRETRPPASKASLAIFRILKSTLENYCCFAL